MSKHLRIHAVTAVIALTVSMTGTALANHQFSDVDDASFFGDSIDAISDAGCATGFDDGTFRPRQDITRGQFAFWLNNCGGRAEHDRDFVILDTDDAPETVASTAIEPGTQANGDRQYVAYVANYTVATLSADLPCFVTFEIIPNGGGLPNEEPEQVVALPLDTAGVDYANGSMTVLVPVDAGHESSATLRAERRAQPGCDAAISVTGSLLAMSFPFPGFTGVPG